MYNNWYVLCFLVDCLLAGLANRQPTEKYCQISTISDNFKLRHPCMEGLDIKLQNSDLLYSNVAALRIQSIMCLSKTPVFYSSTSCAPEYVTVKS
jgi:hypothetical protein